MSGYGYSSGNTAYGGTGPLPNEWSRTSYAGDGYNDHVCRPVIVDAEGRKRPVVSFTPTDTYITKTEIVEQVLRPSVTDYRSYGSVATEPPKDYEVHYRWRRSSSPVHDRPPKVEEFITNVQTDVSRPPGSSPLNRTYRHQSPQPYPTTHRGPNGYDDYKDHSNSDWNKPSYNVTRDKDFDDYSYIQENKNEPAAITAGSRARPSYGGLAAPQRHHETPLSSATNDIGTALEFLKDAVTTTPSVTTGLPRTRFTVSVPPPRRATYPAETIDSREAQRRYGNYNASSRPISTGDAYTTTIDSREAEKRYNGVRVG